MVTHSAGLYLTSVLIWGSTWFAIKFQLGVVAAEVSLVYRFGIAVVILLLFCLASGRRLRYSPSQHGFIALQGLFLFYTNYLIFFEDYQWTLRALFGFALVVIGNYIVLTRSRRRAVNPAV